jgi:uncharacterized membrane protein YhiD involved in acid resistance
MIYTNGMRRKTGLRQNRRSGCGIWTAVFVGLTILLLFFFEYLGSEQPQKWVEEPVAIPEKIVEPEKSKD